MKIKLLFFNKEQDIDLSGVNIFLGDSNSGKTVLSEIILKGFQGIEEGFLVNGVEMDKTKYEVSRINDGDFQTELKMASKSVFTTFIKKELELEQSLIAEKEKLLETCVEDINAQLKEKYYYVEHDFGNGYLPQIKIPNLQSFLLNNLSIEESVKNLSSSHNKEIYFYLKCYLESNNKQRIFIIDDFDGFDVVQAIKMFELAEEKKIMLILFAKNTSILKYMKLYSIYFLRNKSIYSFDYLQQILTQSIKSTSDLNNEVFNNHMLLQNYEIADKKIQIITEYLSLISDLFISKDGFYLLNFLKNELNDEKMTIFRQFLKKMND